MNAASQRRITPWLAGTALVFGLLWVLLLSGIGRGVYWNPPRPTPPLPAARDDSGLPTPLPLEQFAIVWQKPLFNPDRKPIARAASEGGNLGDMELTGIILTRDLHMALLHDKSGDKHVRVREGDSLPDGSWKLAELKPRTAVFEGASGRTELNLPAGAPITPPSPNDANANNVPPPMPGMAVPMQPPPPVVSNGPSAPVMQVQQVPNNATPPPQAADVQQAERIRQLKANILKRRAEQAAAPEGVR
ncbi:general secretion pathway protein GspN [Dyella tabacisoli]|uniref:General secretion pathway protein GspN n=1 Tax=Dyella tabacisoli TaxID=2282381 RepID=A0A369ULY2_9GAMM|nr:general secretion pathway protein GspN [Dyella tabacisoli]RDD80718.1 general secretion pathway protein GspN [Dyella tabacisoli]